MQRLDDAAALAFVARAGVAAVFFGHPAGRITALQAATFAELWAEHAGEVRFGHLDAHAHPEAREAFMIRALPTILVFRDGDLVETFEGWRPRAAIAAALRSRPAAESEVPRLPKPAPRDVASARAERHLEGADR